MTKLWRKLWTDRRKYANIDLYKEIVEKGRLCSSVARQDFILCGGVCTKIENIRGRL